MSSSLNSQRSKISYDNESFETAEESLVDDGKSSPVVWGRQESVFLAESSSSSSEEVHSLGHGQKSKAFCSERSTSESYETILSESVVESENIDNNSEERDYSDQFESASLISEEEFSKKDQSVSEAQENERQDVFIRRKLAVLSSRQSDSKTGNFTEQNKDEELVGCDEMKNFCSRKLQIVAMNGYSTDSQQCEHTLSSNEQPVDQPVVGNKRKIESLKIENLMNKTEKLIKHKDYHDPRHCSDCRSMKSNIAKNTFLKRKAEIVKRSEFEDRLQMHLYQKDSATLIAEIVNSCTKATAPANEVWQKFLNTGGDK